MTWYKISWWLEFLQMEAHAIRDERQVMEFTQALVTAGFDPTVEIYEGDERPIPDMRRKDY